MFSSVVSAMRVSCGIVSQHLLTLLTLSCPGGERARGERVCIAFAGPTSGRSAADRLSAARAIELVLERANEAGGVGGRRVILDVYDDATDPLREAGIELAYRRRRIYEARQAEMEVS